MLLGTLAPLSRRGTEQPSVNCSWHKMLSGNIQCPFVVVANSDLEELLDALHNLQAGRTLLHAALCCSLPFAFLFDSTCSWLKIHGKQLSHSAKAFVVSKVFPFSAGMKTRTVRFSCLFVCFCEEPGRILPEKPGFHSLWPPGVILDHHSVFPAVFSYPRQVLQPVYQGQIRFNVCLLIHHFHFPGTDTFWRKLFRRVLSVRDPFVFSGDKHIRRVVNHNYLGMALTALQKYPLLSNDPPESAESSF